MWYKHHNSNCLAPRGHQLGVCRVQLISMLLAGLCSAALLAQPVEATTVLGAVIDSAGRPVAGAVIDFVNEANSRSLSSDITASDGTYRIVLNAGTAVEHGSPDLLPTAFGLSPNYPNPFNPSTLIPYQIGKTARVRLRVYNLLGQPIRTLVDQLHVAGSEIVEWDGRNDRGEGVGAGIYVVRMEAEGVALTRKMLLLDGANTSIFFGTPRRKNTVLQRQPTDFYSVHIAGDNIESFSRMQIAIAADTTLNFTVARRPLLVAAGGSIDAALQKAQPGDIVELSAGTYTGQTVQLKEGVTLRGKGPSRSILSASFLTAAQLSGAVVADLTLKNSGSSTTPAIAIVAAEVTLHNCHIEENVAFCAIQI